MIVYLNEISNLDLKYVRYYTVTLKGKTTSEFDDFIHRMRQKPEMAEELIVLNRHIENIGNHYGAQLHLFKPENEAQRLPIPTHYVEADFGIRLYCIVLSENIVILINGDHKTSQKVKDCPNCHPHFKLANKIAKSIYLGIDSGLIEIEEKEIYFMADDYQIEI